MDEDTVLEKVIEEYKSQDTSKVVIVFQAIGSAPILKKPVFKLSASHKFQTVIQFLRKELRCQEPDALFLYINSAFSPSPDETIYNLHKCFNTRGSLIVSYCTTAAWG